MNRCSESSLTGAYGVQKCRSRLAVASLTLQLVLNVTFYKWQNDARWESANYKHKTKTFWYHKYIAYIDKKINIHYSLHLYIIKTLWSFHRCVELAQRSQFDIQKNSDTYKATLNVELARRSSSTFSCIQKKTAIYNR
jgi:hypothetical protein